MLLGFGVVGVAVFLQLGQGRPAGGNIGTGALLFCAGASIGPAKYLPSTTYVLDNVDPDHSGKVLALMDVPGYFLSAMFFREYPGVVASRGWGAVFMLLAAMVGVATVCIVAQQRRYRAAAPVPQRI